MKKIQVIKSTLIHEKTFNKLKIEKNVLNLIKVSKNLQ